MRPAAGVTLIALRLTHCARSLEGRRNLLIQFHPICHHHEGPVAGYFAQDLLGKEDHGKALPAALRLPKDPAASMSHRARFQRRGDGVVHAEELMILPKDLHQPGFVLGEKGEILHQIEQPRFVASPAQHHLQRHPARLIFALNPFPLEEPLPIRGQRTHPAVCAVRGDQQRVIPEKRRDLSFVMRQIFIKCRARRHSRLLQLDHHERQAIDKPDQIRTAGVKRPRDAELADQQEIVVRRAFPIHHSHPFRFLPAVFVILHGNEHPVFQQEIHLPICRLQTHRRTVAGQFIQGGGNGLRRQSGIQSLQCPTQSRHQHYVALGLPPQCSANSETLLRRRHRLPA